MKRDDCFVFLLFFSSFFGYIVWGYMQKRPSLVIIYLFLVVVMAWCGVVSRTTALLFGNECVYLFALSV